MSLLNTSKRYGSLSIALHWLMLALLAAVYLCIELRGYFPKGSDPREALKAWHFMLGLSVLALVVVRLAVNLPGSAPRISPPPPRWQAIASTLMHGALYLFMLAMPILGWLLLSAKAEPVPFFGLELPALIGPGKELAESLEEVHETIGELGYWLIGAHAAAALAHHYLVRDDTLRRILPRWGRA